MKKNILTLALCLLLGSYTTHAQNEETEAQAELGAEVDEGFVKLKSEDGLYSFRVGARAAVDGALYKDQFTDRGSGTKFSSARIRVISKLGRKLDFKFDVDFTDKNFLKDVYLRYHTNKHGFLRVGNFAEAFSGENIQSTMDNPFISKSATNQALAPGRAVGVAYRYYHPYFWGEAGFYGQKVGSTETQGDKGWAASARLLARYESKDFNIHVGGSFNYRKPNANGFSQGNDDYNRTVSLGSTIESVVDDTKFLNTTISNVKNGLKWNVEAWGNYKNVYLRGEYTGAKFNRERDFEYMFKSSLGSMMSVYFPTLESFKMLMGEDIPAKVNGFSVEGGWLLFGGDYKYSNVDALMKRPRSNSLELVMRYNHTNLNDIEDGSIFYGDKFYSNAMAQEFSIANQSIAGGKANTFTVGLNYYATSNVIVKLNYIYQKLDQPYNHLYALDKDLHAFQARVAYEF